MHAHLGSGLRSPRVLRNEVSPADYEVMVWQSFGVGWATASRILGRHEAFDICQAALERVWELKDYLRVRQLGGFYVKVCWSLAASRAKRRWREVLGDERAMERAQVRATQLERGHRVGPHSTEAR